MKKTLKWTGIILLLLILVAAAAVFVLSYIFDKTRNSVHIVRAEPLELPADSLSIAQGKQLAALCTSCHGDQLAGRAMFDDPGLATIYAPNLTGGTGGIGNQYSVEDWVRAIRHGVGPDNRPLMIMPSQEYHYLSQYDLGKLIAYLKSLPAVDHETGAHRFTTMAKVLGTLGAFGTLFAAREIDHNAPFAEAPKADVSARYGEYMVNVSGCRTCHGAALNGGKDPNPEAPPGPNLTPGGRLSGWSEADFLTLMATGTTPDGRKLNTEYMPWNAYGKMDETSLKAIFTYLRSLPPAPSAVKEEM